MKLLTEETVFSQKLALIEKMIQVDKRLPDQVFKDQMLEFIFIDFDEIFSAKFFDHIKVFLKMIQNKNCYLSVLDPDPRDYFFHYFGKYSFIEFSVDETSMSYIQILQADPGDSPADAIAINSTIVAIYSDSADWVIYGDRNMELGIFGCSNSSLMNDFVSSYMPGRVFDVKNAIEKLVQVSYHSLDTGVPLNIREKLSNNYKCDLNLKP